MHLNLNSTSVFFMRFPTYQRCLRFQIHGSIYFAATVHQHLFDRKSLFLTIELEKWVLTRINNELKLLDMIFLFYFIHLNPRRQNDWPYFHQPCNRFHCVSTVSTKEFESCLQIPTPEPLMAPPSSARCFISLRDWSGTRVWML